MDIFFEGFFELLIFAVIIIAQIIAAAFAKKKKRRQQEQAQLKHTQQRPVPASVGTVKIKAAKTAAPPNVQRSKQPVAAANSDKVKALEHARKAAQKNVQNEEVTAYSQVTSTAAPENTLLAQARTGIIWTEILLPPVSMRLEKK